MQPFAYLKEGLGIEKSYSKVLPSTRGHSYKQLGKALILVHVGYKVWALQSNCMIITLLMV